MDNISFQRSFNNAAESKETTIVRKFFRMLKFELKIVFAIEPIIINIIALALCCGIWFIVNTQLIPYLGKWQPYVLHAVQLLAAYQVIKSANKSLLIPSITILIALIGFYGNQYFPQIIGHLNIYKTIMLVGVIGLARSIWNMY